MSVFTVYVPFFRSLIQINQPSTILWRTIVRMCPEKDVQLLHGIWRQLSKTVIQVD